MVVGFGRERGRVGSGGRRGKCKRVGIAVEDGERGS